MTISILRTAENWWVHTPTGAVRIDTTAATTGELLADRDAITSAAYGEDAVPVDTLALLSPVTAPCRVVAQMLNFRSHAQDSGINPDTVPTAFFRKASGSISGPFDDIIKPAHVRLVDYGAEIGLVFGRDVPVGTRITAANLSEFVAGLVVTNDVSARPATAQNPVLRIEVVPDLHPGRSTPRPARRHRTGPLHRPATATAGQRPTAPGPHRCGHDRRPSRRLAGCSPVSNDSRPVTCC